MQDRILPDHRSDYQAGPSQPTRAAPDVRKGGPELRALGCAVREMRARRGHSQESLGAAAAGTHRNYIGAIERGEINPTFRLLLNVLHGLCIPLTEFAAVYERQYMAQLGVVPAVPSARTDDR
jgi:DNA-binding XRE family transcriptional regulator